MFIMLLNSVYMGRDLDENTLDIFGFECTSFVRKCS